MKRASLGSEDALERIPPELAQPLKTIELAP
jgi:hypothetical protein